MTDVTGMLARQNDGTLRNTWEELLAQGPLTGVRAVEFAGLGPAPFCGMLLSDLGADILRIDRKDGDRGEKTDRKSVG